MTVHIHKHHAETNQNTMELRDKKDFLDNLSDENLEMCCMGGYEDYFPYRTDLDAENNQDLQYQPL